MSDTIRNNLREIDKVIAALQTAHNISRNRIYGVPSGLPARISLALDSAQEVRKTIMGLAWDEGLLELKE